MERDRQASKSRQFVLLASLFALLLAGYLMQLGCGKQEPRDPEPPNMPDTAGQAAIEAAMDPKVLGNKVYQERCALCHGPGGKGDGPAAAGLNPKPRNHTDGAYMKTRTDDQLLEVIRHGKGGMPAWGGILSETAIQAVLKHVRSLAK